MPEHLLLMELGPVEQLIAAARKTRDMWYGSWLLSEVAKAAAKACGDYQSVISPAAQSDADYEDPKFSIGDEIVVVVPEGTDPTIVAARAKLAAHHAWQSFAESAYNDVTRILESEIWQEQVRANDAQWEAESLPQLAGETVEVYSVWAPLADRYSTTLDQVRRLMLGRTMCRNFPVASGHANRPKSSLDGRRESVLNAKVKNVPDEHQTRRLRLNGIEQLDALGVTKRVGGGKKNYPSTARLAADPWMRGRNREGALDNLVAMCEELASHGLGRISIQPSDDESPCYPKFEPFPFEGSILYETRHEEFLRENASDSAILDPLREELTKLIRGSGEPGKYYAVLIADGDGVGKRIRECKSHKDHRAFSQTLSAFTVDVRSIVEKHFGATVFAAGEDITAFLPVDHVVQCANALRQKFAEIMPDGVTLSVGICIGHFLDSLEEVVSNAWQMEGVAKQGEKNALAIRYLSRGGAPLQCRYSWETDPARQIDDWCKLLATGKIPDKVAYDLQRVARVYDAWPADSDEDRQMRKHALRADATRSLSRKSNSVADQLQPLVNEIHAPADLRNLSSTLIIARQILISKRAAGELDQ